jgi:dipeptidyl aminopeptidase/acylaminoacyl peptidase
MSSCRFAILVPVVIALATARGSSQAPPATDIYLARLTTTGGTLSVGSARNLTARDGYDNQPSWSPDGRSIYFTSVRDGKVDIYRLEVASGATTPVTNTAVESEYSATVMHGGNAISVIRVEADSTQRLWTFPLAGGEPSVILERVKPVGYHAWADSVTLALFVLGSPNTLQLADSRTGRADTVVTNIGRSLHRVPGQKRISFVHKVSADEWWLTLLDPATRATERMVRMPKGVEDYAWTPGGVVIAGDGSALKAYDPRRGGEWQPIGDLGAAGLSSITRLSVSPRGDQIAIVAVPK